MEVKFTPAFTGSIEQNGIKGIDHLVSGRVIERMYNAPANTTLSISHDGENTGLLAIMFKIGKKAAASIIGSKDKLTERYVNSVITRGLETLNENAAPLDKII